MLLALLLSLAVPNVDGILRVMDSEGLAHACPVSSSLAVTNAHVAGRSRLIWSVGDLVGLLRRTHSSEFRDLAWVVPENGSFPTWYSVSVKQPAEGETLWFIGYDWRGQDKAFAQRVFKVEVVRVLGGHVAFKPAGVPGSSGSCVLNERGEVVAVNKGGLQLDDKTWIGVAVGIWGSLLQFGEAH